MTPIAIIIGQALVLGIGVHIGLKIKKIVQDQENKRLVRIPVPTDKKRQ
jgi:hypothetical protein